MSSRTWRKEPVKSAGGVSWRLVAGRADDRIRLNLGRVTEEEAETCRASMQVHEEAGHAARVLDLHREDPAEGVLFLLGDPGARRVLPEPRIDYGRMTLRAYFEEHYREHRAKDRPATWRTERGHWRRVLEGLGDARLREIQARMFWRWVRDLRVERSGGVRRGQVRKEGALVPTGERTQPASGAYQRLLRSALQALLTRAYTEEHLEEHVKLGELQIRGSTLPARDKPAPLSLAELGRLLEVSTGKFRALWAVAAGEGLRPSEVCRLRWEHVRWSSHTLLVPGTKTDASADEIPLTPIAHRELRAWWVARGQPAEGVLFPASADGAAYTAESGYKRALLTAATKAGIGRPVTPYLLRHSFATIAWSLGIDMDTARRVLRHTDETMLREVYCRPRPADLVARVAAFDVG